MIYYPFLWYLGKSFTYNYTNWQFTIHSYLYIWEKPLATSRNFLHPSDFIVNTHLHLMCLWPGGGSTNFHTFHSGSNWIFSSIEDFHSFRNPVGIFKMSWYVWGNCSSGMLMESRYQRKSLLCSLAKWSIACSSWGLSSWLSWRLSWISFSISTRVLSPYALSGLARALSLLWRVDCQGSNGGAGACGILRWSCLGCPSFPDGCTSSLSPWFLVAVQGGFCHLGQLGPADGGGLGGEGGCGATDAGLGRSAPLSCWCSGFSLSE